LPAFVDDIALRLAVALSPVSFMGSAMFEAGRCDASLPSAHAMPGAAGCRLAELASLAGVVSSFRFSCLPPNWRDGRARRLWHDPKRTK
jgi:hypothetical protein